MASTHPFTDACLRDLCRGLRDEKFVSTPQYARYAGKLIEADKALVELPALRARVTELEAKLAEIEKTRKR